MPSPHPPSDVCHLTVHTEQEAAGHPVLAQVSVWMAATIARPHPLLGRPGAMCPFVPLSLRLGLVRYAVSEPDACDALQVERAAVALKRCWETMPPLAGKHMADKAVVLVLPHASPATIVAVHDRLKPHYVGDGLMLGEFYPGHDGPGRHNPAFHPLHSPVPLLVARSMVTTDLPFLIEDRYSPARRAEFADAFLRHQPAAPHDVREQARAVRERALALLSVSSPPRVPRSGPVAGR
ncbi:DUF6875 domain-containing protein [Streptomyces cinnamoneus]|uniref:DUF6875 domain-containing protein n=1 Tax=Streptomyces cinnamoneus TaxID=53446 RepID=UPI003436EC2F